jgi:thiol-disulfide isomerase/thioredoxin
LSEELKRKAEGQSRLVPIIAAIAAAIAGFLVIYGQLPQDGNKAPPGGTQTASGTQPALPGLAGLNKGKMTTFVFHKAPLALPDVAFVDGSGAERKLASFKGRIVLLNLWATWCAPCRHEMPALDRLQQALGGKDFEVVALSTDRGGLEKPRKFLAEIGVAALAPYNDASGRISSELKVIGMPTTLLLDRQGREIGRLVGPAEWDSEDAKALIDAAVKAAG